MTRLLSQADDLLRGRHDDDAVAPAAPGRRPRDLLLTLLAFGLLYGATMGTFGGLHGDRPLQILYSAIKVPLLLLVTFALSLPGFFVLNSVAGLRGDFARVLRALLATQAGLTVVLASFAPLTAFWYVAFSGADAYDAALLFNTAMFAAASLSAQWMLRRSYRGLIAADPRHRALLRVWLLVYAFVGIQTAWVLRPFVGKPLSPVSFFRAGAWGNAYEEVAHTFARAVGM